MFTGMLVEAADLQPEVASDFAGRRLDVAEEQLQEGGLANAVRTYSQDNNLGGFNFRKSNVEKPKMIMTKYTHT